MAERLNDDAEEYRPLREAARWVPSRRANRPTHASTLYRWATRGVQGVKLEVTRMGGSLCCTRAALYRFFETLTKLDQRLATTPRELRPEVEEPTPDTEKRWETGKAMHKSATNDHVEELLRRRGLKK